MAYDRPSLSDLIARIRADLLSRLTADDVLRRADTEVQARVLAGTAHGLYGYIEWLAEQLIYDTAESDYLERWASIWGIARKAAATASGTVTFAVEAGAVIESGTVLQSLDGAQYETTAEATVSGTSATAPVEAVEAGEAGNRDAGQALLLVSPIVGVQSTATAGELSGGSDEEEDDSLRARLLTRIQTPPQGGAKSDYVTWALEVSGVTRAWCYPLELGLGTVTLRFVRDDDADPIPSAEEVATVQAYIDALRPVTAQLTVAAPIAQPLNFTISGLIPASSTVRAAVEAELADLILREAEPGGTLLLSHIRAAISAAADESDHVLVSPTADVACATGYMTTMGAVTWV